MASLTNTKISDTYPLLLKIESNGVDGTLRNVEDGDGTASALQISTGAINVSGTITASGNVDFNGDLDVDGTTNLDVVDIDGAVNISSDSVPQLTIGGSTPTIYLGDSGAEDTKLVFRGNATDVYLALDDSADNFLIGQGTTVGGDTRITLDPATGNTTFAGDVTTSADKRFSVGTWDNSGFGGSAMYGFSVTSSAPIVHLVESDQSGKKAYFGMAGGSAYLGGNSIDNLYFQTGSGSTALTIDSSQNSTFAGGTTTFPVGGVLRFGERGNLTHDSSNYNMTFNTNSLANTLLITGTGNVGIGLSDTSVNNKFQIQVGTDHRIGFWGASSYSAIQSVNDANSAQQDLRFDASAYYFLSGNAGFGTTSPDSITTGVATVSLGGTHATVSGGISKQVNGTVKSYHYVESDVLKDQTVSGVDHAFITGGSHKMRITSGGKVLIGTTSGNNIHDNGLRVVGNEVGSHYGDSALSLEGTGGDFYALNFAISSAYFGFLAASSPNPDYLALAYRTGSTDQMIIQFFANGNATLDGTLTEGSDIRLKENIENIDGALSKVNQMRGVTFDRIDTGKKEYGMIADELEEIIPELVDTADDGDIEKEIPNLKSIKYTKLTSILIEAVKELSAQNDALTSRIEALENA